jgi:hypothetical protein
MGIYGFGIAWHCMALDVYKLDTIEMYILPLALCRTHNNAQCYDVTLIDSLASTLARCKSGLRHIKTRACCKPGLLVSQTLQTLKQCTRQNLMVAGCGWRLNKKLADAA